MPNNGTAAKSATGASMSKYDVEVDARLKALEEKVNSPSGESVGSSDERITALEKKLDDLIYKLSTKMTL